MKTDLELLKEYLQSEIDCGNHKLFIFDENNNATELKTIDGFNAITDLEQEIERLNNIINEIEWKPIDEYFKNKEKYDWVLVKYYDKHNFECIPSVAEYRFDKWYLKDNEKSLQDFEVRYFFDIQQLNKLKELKESDNND